jgi:hypothetical protein
MICALGEMEKTKEADAFSERLISDLRRGKPEMIEMPELLGKL